ncbi:MAG: molecular chaperone HtpG [Isosphaeraceae bacterium]
MSSATESGQEFTFQAEIKQLLHLLSHSLYQSREIALRELISNASDALDKMRFIALTDAAHRASGPFEIVMEPRPDARELSIRDNGIGMTREELIANLGTIAHSGSREFLRGLAAASKASQGQAQEDASAGLSLIGQFGVGFYSAFMIADKVRVRTRSHAADTGWEWESDGSGSFRIAPAEGLARGTEVILHLKEDAKEFADAWRLKTIIRRYSGFVPHPILIDGVVVNDQKPIWVEPKSQVTDEQYRQFYQHLTHHPDESPLWHIHLSVDSPIQFQAILYCPPRNLEMLGLGRSDHGLSLCAKRVLVQSDCRDILPEYLRFLYGIVDSEDLPLNVSRETLQDSSVFRKIRNSLVKSTLDRLQRMAEEEPESYRTFYQSFGIYLKEGAARDYEQRQRLAKLLRFASTRDERAGMVSFDDYVANSQADQRRIYFLGGPDPAALKKNPNLEVFRKRGIEVLYLIDPVDEFVMASLGSYDGRTMTSIDSADLGLPDVANAIETPPQAAPAGLDRVLALFREALEGRVAEVRVSKRLTDSPCCLVNADGQMSTQMQRLLRMTQKDYVPASRILEINPDAPLIQRLAILSANPSHEEFLRDCGRQLWADALMLEGELPDPEATVARIQSLLEQAAQTRSPLIGA